MLNNMKFSMLVNMHVSEHDMLFSDEPTLKVIVPPKYVHCTNILHNDDDFLDQFSTGWFFGLK